MREKELKESGMGRRKKVLKEVLGKEWRIVGGPNVDAKFQVLKGKRLAGRLVYAKGNAQICVKCARKVGEMKNRKLE